MDKKRKYLIGCLVLDIGAISMFLLAIYADNRNAGVIGCLLLGPAWAAWAYATLIEEGKNE